MMSNSINPLSFDINGIKECQRNRYPLLFVDRITHAIPGKSARGIKCFSYNEWFFPAHFDDEPTVPGFVLIECMVQTFIMSFLCLDEYRGKKTSFAGINNVKFKRKIIPGEQLMIDTSLTSFKRGIAHGIAEGRVEGNLACSAEFIVTIPDVLNSFKPSTSSGF